MSEGTSTPERGSTADRMTQSPPVDQPVDYWPEEHRQAAYDSGYADGRAAAVQSLANGLDWDDQGVTLRRLSWMTDREWQLVRDAAREFYAALGCVEVTQ